MGRSRFHAHLKQPNEEAWREQSCLDSLAVAGLLSWITYWTTKAMWLASRTLRQSKNRFTTHGRERKELCRRPDRKLRGTLYLPQSRSLRRRGLPKKQDAPDRLSME
eukprot:3490821-Amphidinium_carterae.1